MTAPRPGRTLRTCLWFAGGGEEAAAFYVALLPDSRIEGVVERTAGRSWSSSPSRARR